jgi:DNA invertase Pin-like site-specific DNA recombinase
MQNVVGYVRVSTQGQVKDGYSLQYQVDEITVIAEITTAIFSEFTKIAESAEQKSMKNA